MPPEVKEKEDDFKVEIVDDTPPEDKGRVPLPPTVVEELEKDDLDEYSDKVKKRLGQMKKVWHDERRAKESAAREKDEALQFAQRVFEENKTLKQRLGQGEKVFISEVTKAAETEATSAKEKLKQAYEAGDAAKIADAQDALTDAKLKLREYKNFRPTLQDDGSGVEIKPQATPAPQVQTDAKAEAWRQKNTWFGADKEMTALALGLHEKLYESGVDPRSEDYYQKINMTMRKRFPEYFEGEEQPQITETREETPPPRKSATVVAPATRSTAPRQVRLTSTEAAIAKRLGLTPEAYAREKLKLENRNG